MIGASRKCYIPMTLITISRDHIIHRGLFKMGYPQKLKKLKLERLVSMPNIVPKKQFGPTLNLKMH